MSGVCNLGWFGGDCDGPVYHLVAPLDLGGLWLGVVSKLVVRGWWYIFEVGD